MTEHEISPLDGRYRARLAELPAYFSEFALMRTRCEVELAYLEALDRTRLFPSLTDEDRQRIDRVRASFSGDDFERIVEIDRAINHDVKACELYLRERLGLAQPNLIHFGLTSTDVDNLAYGLLLTRFRDEQQLPHIRRLIERLADGVEAWKSVVFPARTHGQPASPTTLGKEFAVFLSRLLRQATQLAGHRFRGKLTGATGTHASFVAAFPDHDWMAFSGEFVESLGLEPNRCTTQIEDHDTLAEYFAIVARINNIASDLDRDLWEYISRGDLIERRVDAEVGSSTMPHKVNPIRFENSEGNVAMANALLHAFSDKLTQSRMQRDLSDKTVKRNIGVALAHSHLAIGQTIDGLERIDVDEEGVRRVVDSAPEVLAEGYQTILREAGIENPYELLRGLTRGEAVTLDRLHEFVDGLSVADNVKRRLLELRPTDYIGLASRICDEVLEAARVWLAS
jgi:adenylosuccinate lyase